MRLLAGMDGGGTRTRLVIAGEDGGVVARAEGGCCSFVELGVDGAREALGALWREAWRSAGREPRQADALSMGMGSILAPGDAKINCQLAVSAGLVTGLDRVEAVNDAESALAGGLAGRPGLLLIAGTGSVCVGRNAEGQSGRAGGWGHLLEDQGSAHALGRAAMVASTRAEDGRGRATSLRRLVCECLGLGDLKEIYRRLHHDGVPRSQIASLAKDVVVQAGQGDPVAQNILAEGARGLVEMVETVARRLDLERSELVLTGGLIEGAKEYRRLFEDELKAVLPELRITSPVLSPVLGAVLMAGRLGMGGRIPEGFLGKLAQ